MSKLSSGLRRLRTRTHGVADARLDVDAVDHGAPWALNDPRWTEHLSAVPPSRSCEWLFHASAEPVLIVDANTENIVEGNPAAAALFHVNRTALVGSLFLQFFDAANGPLIRDSFAMARKCGSANALCVRALDGRKLTLRLTLCRTSLESYFLVHPASSVAAESPCRNTSASSHVFDDVDGAPFGFLVTDSDFRVQYANRAFLKMVQIISHDEVRGEPLARWIKLSKAQFAILGEQLSNRRAVEELTAAIWSQDKAQRGVEVSAVAVPESKTTAWGFCIRELSRLH